MSRKSHHCLVPESCTRLEDIPNVGPATAADLRLLGIDNPADLAGRDPFKMYDELSRITNMPQDPCVIDVFMAAVSFMKGEPVRRWWEFTPERKSIQKDAAQKNR